MSDITRPVLGLIVAVVIVLVFLGVLFIIKKHKQDGGYLRQDYARLQRTSGYGSGTKRLCGLTGTLPLLVSDFLINETRANLNRMSNRQPEVQEFQKLIIRDRDKILDVNKGYQIGNLCRLGTFIYKYAYGDDFNFLKFGKLFLGIQEDLGNYNKWIPLVDDAKSWYNIGFINPVLAQGEEKILLAVRTKRWFNFTNYKIIKLATTIPAGETVPISPILQLGEDTHVHLYMYNERIARWVDYNDSQTNRAKTYTLAEFEDLFKRIIANNVINYYLYIYEKYLNAFIAENSSDFWYYLD